MNNPFISCQKKYGVNIIKNNITYKAIVKDAEDSLIKTIKVTPNIISYGDYISYKNNDYLVNTFVIEKGIYDEFEIKLCNNILKYKALIDGAEGVISIPAIVEKGTISLDTGQITVIDNELTCVVGYSNIDKVKHITVGFRFILNGTVWEVIGVDNVSSMLKQQEGTIFIQLKSDQMGAGDDLITGLAYNAVMPVITTPHVYLIQATEQAKTIENTRTSQVNVVCSTDGVIDNSPTLIYSSLDSNICTVSNTGVINAIGVGSTNIKVTYKGVTTSVAINVIEKIEIYTLIGSDNINEAVAQNYKIIDESGLDSTLEYTFEIDNPSLVTIESFGANYVNIIGTNIEGSIVLTVTNTIDTSKTYTKVINTLFNAHTYTINATETNVSVNKAETHQLTVNCTDNGVVISNPIVNYSSSNEAIATDNASGVVTGVNGDNCIITVSFLANDGITYSSTINTKVVVASVVTYDITNSMNFLIRKTSTGTFYPHKALNGVEQTGVLFEFELDRRDLTTAQITIIETTSSYIKIKNVGVETFTPAKTILLKYREVGNVDWLEKEIVVKGLYG